MRPLNERDDCPGFHPEEAGIMLDRLAVELLHAQAKNPRAVPALQEAAQELLACVGAWLATFDTDELPITAQVIASDMEPGLLAQTLRGLADVLIFFDEIAESRGGGDGDG